MKTRITFGDFAKVVFTREGASDPDFDGVIQQFQYKHPEDITEIVMSWESFSVR